MNGYVLTTTEETLIDRLVVVSLINFPVEECFAIMACAYRLNYRMLMDYYSFGLFHLKTFRSLVNTRCLTIMGSRISA